MTRFLVATLAVLALTLPGCFLRPIARTSATPTPAPATPSGSAQPTASPVIVSPAPTRAETAPATPAAAASPGATSTNPDGSERWPVGFPLDPNLKPWRVVEGPRGREVQEPLPNGPTIFQVAKEIFPRPVNDMPSNQYGWNCRTHYQYEDNQPAVDWYLPTGTPVIATMDATAELYIITTKNSFTYYNYPTNLYLGLPPANAPGYPFSGPSGGMGVFISLVAEGIPVRAEYGHLDPSRTIAHVPENAFVPPYSRTYNYDAAFGTMKGPRDFTLIARWPVKRGQVIGYVGNSGYSDVPHLHYQIITPDRNTKYCPSEENFPRSGWLFRRPL